jgi:hypothetical protein
MQRGVLRTFLLSEATTATKRRPCPFDLFIEPDGRTTQLSVIDRMSAAIVRLVQK